MSLPYFPMYPSDFEAKTSHLTLEEDGAYNRLLRLCWMTPGCSLPDDPTWIARRMRIDMDTFARVVAPLLDEFFTRAKGRVQSPKLSRISDETNEKHTRRVEAGKKGGRPAKALKTKEMGQSYAKAMPKQPEPEPEPDKKEEPYGSLSLASDEAAQALAEYNAAAKQAGWPSVQLLTKPRRQAVLARLKECGGLSGWRDALARARASPHCCGQNDRGWTASFDFLTRQSSFAKLMEGNYDAKPRTDRRSQQRRIDPALEQIARLTGLSAAPGDGCH
jgi:uncharacterized protein YdaU (DUF1376 family)